MKMTIGVAEAFGGVKAKKVYWGEVGGRWMCTSASEVEVGGTDNTSSVGVLGSIDWSRTKGTPWVVSMTCFDDRDTKATDESDELSVLPVQPLERILDTLSPSEPSSDSHLTHRSSPSGCPTHALLLGLNLLGSADLGQSAFSVGQRMRGSVGGQVLGVSSGSQVGRRGGVERVGLQERRWATLISAREENGRGDSEATYEMGL
jgi:hypothetical protein